MKLFRRLEPGINPEIEIGRFLTTIVGFQNTPPLLGTVEWVNGEEREADLAVVGIGVTPTVGFLDGSGLELDDGVVVDERFETSLPGIYAVGDVARFYDPVFGRSRRIDSAL